MPISVVLLSQDSEVQRQWTAWLVRAADLSASPCGPAIGDVVVADATVEAAEVARTTAASGAGLIAVGIELPGADAVLSADCLPRELVLVCRLVGQVAQLRRQAREPDSRQAALRDAK